MLSDLLTSRQLVLPGRQVQYCSRKRVQIITGRGISMQWSHGNIAFRVTFHIKVWEDLLTQGTNSLSLLHVFFYCYFPLKLYFFIFESNLPQTLFHNKHSTTYEKNKWIEKCTLVWVVVTVMFQMFLKSLIHSVFQWNSILLSTYFENIRHS